MSTFNTDSGTVTYEAVRKAMGGEPYAMSLRDTGEIRAVIKAVNQGIDSHLEACCCPDRGDRFEGGKRTIGKLTLCRTLECCVSPESLPVLLRRLCELDTDDHITDAGTTLTGDILLTLGLDEST
ncbi:MAG: hypothetical protein ACYC0X_23480 [Pirellulaceae bacterium]